MKTAISTSILARKDTQIIPPLFDLIEEDDFYLMSIDLPGLPDSRSEIEMNSSEIKVKQREASDSLLSHVLFRCRSDRGRLRAIYYQGSLWILLPKEERSKASFGMGELIGSAIAALSDDAA